MIITREVSINPEFLDASICDKLIELLNTNLKYECSKETGYILRVSKIISLSENYISRTSGRIVFIAKFDAETLYPESGMILEGKVIKIFSQGILLIVKERMKALIPSTTIKNRKFNRENVCYEKEDDSGDKIEEDSIINIKIHKTKYNNKEFNCIGELIE